MVGLCRFKLSYFEFPITSNAKPFPLDLPFSHFLLALSKSHYLEFSFVSLESFLIVGFRIFNCMKITETFDVPGKSNNSFW